MSVTMQSTVLIKVLSKFDKNGEVKMNKIAAGSYNRPGSGYGSYDWTFYGPIKGVDTRLKLVRISESEYNLVKSVTQEVQEVIKA